MICIFFRKDGWYPIDMMRGDEAEAKDHADLNPGTVRIETWDGKVLWDSAAAKEAGGG